MSGGKTVNPFQTVMSDPTVRAKAYALIRQVGSMAAGALTGWLVAKGVGLAEATILAGSVVALGGAIASVTWSMIDASSTSMKVAAGMTSALLMAKDNKALAADGTTLVVSTDGVTPPKPVTLATMAQITKDYPVDPSSIAKA